MIIESDFNFKLPSDRNFRLTNINSKNVNITTKTIIDQIPTRTPEPTNTFTPTPTPPPTPTNTPTPTTTPSPTPTNTPTPTTTPSPTPTNTPTSVLNNCGSRIITDQNLIDLLNNSTQVRYQYSSVEGSADVTIPWSSSTVYEISYKLTPDYPLFSHFVHLGLSWNNSNNTLYYTSYDEALLASVVLIPIGKITSECSGINVATSAPENPSGGTFININGNSYLCGQYCALPFPISPVTVSLTFS